MIQYPFKKYLVLALGFLMFLVHPAFAKDMNKLHDVGISEEEDKIQLNLATTMSVKHIIKSHDNNTLKIILPNTLQTNQLLEDNALPVLNSKNIRSAKLSSDDQNVYLEMNGNNIANKHLDINYLLQKKHTQIIEPSYREESPSHTLKLTSGTAPRIQPDQPNSPHQNQIMADSTVPRNQKKNPPLNTHKVPKRQAFLPKSVDHKELPMVMSSVAIESPVDIDMPILANADLEPTTSIHASTSIDPKLSRPKVKENKGFSLFGIGLTTWLLIVGGGLGGLFLINIILAFVTRFNMSFQDAQDEDTHVIGTDKSQPQSDEKTTLDDHMTSQYKQFEEDLLNDPDKDVKILALEDTMKEPESIEEAFSKVLTLIKEDDY